MPESEETRATDAEVEAAAKALHNESGYPPSRRSPNLAYWRILARAALEAAAALHPPREGAGGEKSSREERYREALERIVSRHPDSPEGEHPAVDIAKDALSEGDE